MHDHIIYSQQIATFLRESIYYCVMVTQLLFIFYEYVKHKRRYKYLIYIYHIIKKAARGSLG